MDYIQQRQDMIQACDFRARRIAETIGFYLHQLRAYPQGNPFPREDFKSVWPHVWDGTPLDRPPHYYVDDHVGQEFIRSAFNRWAHVCLGNFRPVAGKSTTDAPPPVVLDEKMVDSNSNVVANPTDTPTNFDRAFQDHQIITSASEVAKALEVKAGLQFRQLISYGNEASPVQGETEVTASVETAV